MLDRLKNVMMAPCDDWGAELLEMNGAGDHVHLLLGLNPTCARSIVANNFKTMTSRLLRNEFPALRAKYRQPVPWSRSYFVASVGGAPLSAIKQYIEQQVRPLDAILRPACAASPPSKSDGFTDRALRARPAMDGALRRISVDFPLSADGDFLYHSSGLCDAPSRTRFISVG
jgi:putative transposase